MYNPSTSGKSLRHQQKKPKHLGSVIEANKDIKKDFECRIACATSVCGVLRRPVFGDKLRSPLEDQKASLLCNGPGSTAVRSGDVGQQEIKSRLSITDISGITEPNGGQANSAVFRYRDCLGYCHC